MSDRADALIRAHVQHELASFRDEALARTVDAEVASLFAWFEEVRVNDVSSPARVLGVIDRCVIDFRVSGGIAELAGESANKVFSSERNAETRVCDVFPASFWEAFVDKAIALEPVRRDILRQISESDAYHDLISRLVQRGVRDLLFRSGARHERRWRLLDLDVAQRVTPELERFVRGAASRYLERNRERLGVVSRQILIDVVDDAVIRGAADDAWRVLSPMRLGELFAHISTWDLDDFIVLGYEFWLRFRKTRHFRAVTSEVVEHIFDKYGEDSVRALIEDMGVDEAMVREEVLAFLRPFVAEALASGYLEARIRARLETFYRSEVAVRILEGAR